ncbi:unnamed protein product [Anisakis simplex]|uniref:Phospholipid scramblase n=1 Tax=Anisakis simplex TaxID=6269 RepID=A0A0M3JU99_ANISI|nr:unnamed protein product [Anisakis simplex]
MTCENHPEMLSNWSKCVIPQGDLADGISNFLRDVKDHGCKLPPRKVLKFALGFLRNHTGSYINHPLYKRVPSSNCGKCARRVRCCRRSKSFLAQSYESEECANQLRPCMLEPLTENDIAELNRMYPGATAPSDGCDVSSYIRAELQILSNGPAFQYVEPLLCQVVGTKFPSVNCVREGAKCACCCTLFQPGANSSCVPLENQDVMFSCKRDN